MANNKRPISPSSIAVKANHHLNHSHQNIRRKCRLFAANNHHHSADGRCSPSTVQQTNLLELPSLPIVKEHMSSHRPTTATSTSTTIPASSSLLLLIDKSEEYQEPLKDASVSTDNDSQDRSEATGSPNQSLQQQLQQQQPNSVSPSSISKTQRQVTFQEYVSVIQILSHREYSETARKLTWNTSEEMIENSKRNAIEFMAEGRDYNNVIEEDNMWTNSVTGELIHPVHIPTEVVQYHQQTMIPEVDMEPCPHTEEILFLP